MSQFHFRFSDFANWLGEGNFINKENFHILIIVQLFCIFLTSFPRICRVFLYLQERKKLWKAYGTRCSQAVPHPSTILARRCLTSVIRRERVCSSWYGRRQQLLKILSFYISILNIFYIYITISFSFEVSANHKD